MKIIALLIVAAILLAISGTVFLLSRAALRKYRETGSLLLENRPPAYARRGWASPLPGMALVIIGIATLFRGSAWVGLALLGLGALIAAANFLRTSDRHTSGW